MKRLWIIVMAVSAVIGGCMYVSETAEGEALQLGVQHVVHNTATGQNIRQQF